MEFFQELKTPKIDLDYLKTSLSISALPDFCCSIDTVMSEQSVEGEIYCVWGQFNIKRDVIRYGIRFSLLNCPHALAWTITYHESEHEIIIHCTTDKKEQDKDFVESIDQFVDDWKDGLQSQLNIQA
jgi:hypothetical protein